MGNSTIMSHYQEILRIQTRQRGFTDITRRVQDIVTASAISTGLCVVFCRHTSASLTIQENADPTVRTDILNWLERIAPDGDPRYAHDMEGPDDMPAHLRTMITQTSETIPITAGRLTLGTWQGLYLVEHRTVPHSRNIIVHVMGE